jgi:D-sedoheptulose 7-phosphate isomerase
MNKLDQMFTGDNSIKGFAESYLKYVSEILLKISVAEIESFVNELLKARDNGNTIYFIGNGGSAATASHFANDLTIGTRSYHKPFRVVSLCDNMAVITAIGNDDGYENIFNFQLKALLKENDVVVAISASGNSPNLIKAMETIKEKKAVSIGLTSFDGGKLRQMVDISVHVPAEKGEYGPAEDGHMVLDHLLNSYLIRYVKNS